MFCVIPPLLLHNQEVAEEEANDTALLPLQKEVALGVTVGVEGCGLTTTVLEAVPVQPLALVTVTV